MSELYLPDGWAFSTLTTSISADGVISDGDWVESKDQDPNGSVRLIQLADIGDGDFKNKSERFMTSESATALNCTFLKSGDVLIARMPDPLGRACLFPGVGQEAVTVVDVCLIRTGEKAAISNRILTYWINSPAMRNLIDENASGTTRRRITRKKLEIFEFPLPPLAEQKVIADKLDTLLAQVESTKARLERIPDILKRFRQSVLTAAVSGKLTEEWRFTAKSSLTLESFKKSLLSFRAKAKGLDDILENGSWISCQLGHVISVKSGDGLTAKDMALDGDIPVYGGNGINGYHNKSNVSDSVITIGRVGFYCGSVHLTEKQAWITDNALIVDFPEQLFSKDFMYLLLRATNLREDSASTAQPVISGAKIYPIAVKIPPFEEQNEIVRRVEELFTFTDGIEQKATAALARVNNLTQSILAKAFQGELTADWRAANPELISGDNSAAALLEKIKVEREVMKKQPKPKRSNIKKKTGSHMSKQIIKVVDALKEAGEPLSGQQLLAAAGYPSDSGTEQLEQFFLDIRKALISEKSIVKLERRDDGQDWFALAEPMANDE
ncbi:restriction endonuclease subunit S [Shewanella xiamenensis]|uniref:Restriction endonuclease subunit S n=1 Tax=Shewanella xiamenensis TaxID=332186 RepID=A0ABT6UJC6_9GAMM|nr:restriction endonuclease subunit S [Shewanella xiamenensis]MDI5833399.1 restriction endonuclease subunit S [Shewanella xiamenensis]